MKVVSVVNPGPSSLLRLVEKDEPACGVDEVVISVRAAGVNRADLLQRAGMYPPPPGASEVLGLEVAGTIQSMGKNVRGWSVGQKVCAILSGGGYAERVSVPCGQLLSIPQGLSCTQAAAIPEAFLTAYTNLMVEGGLSRGERVLIHGGSSGVGTAAIQLAKRIGAEVACTVGSDVKARRCLELGADLAINYTKDDFASAIKAWSPEGVHVVLDIVGKDYLEKNLDTLAHCGRLVCIATMSGARGELSLSTLMKKRLRIIGSVLRSRSVVEKAALVQGFRDKFLSDFDSGKLVPVIHEVYTFGDVERAHETMRSSAHIGKLVLEVGNANEKSQRS